VINHDQQQRGREIDEALGEVRDIWALTCEDEDERRLASWRIAKRFDPVNEVGFVEYTEWPLLFSLEQSAALGFDWPLDIASYLIEHDPGTTDGRILYQWLSCVIAYYHRDYPDQVEALWRAELLSSEPYRRFIMGNTFAYMIGARAIPVLRQAQQLTIHPGLSLVPALVLAGADEELTQYYRALPFPDKSGQMRNLFRTLGLVPSKAYADAGFPGLAFQDRKALATMIPSLIESGHVLTLFSTLPVDDSTFADWLIARHRSGNRQHAKSDNEAFNVLNFTNDHQVDMLGLLARQSNRAAAKYLADLCRSGDRSARGACAKQWNPRYFPAAKILPQSQVVWIMDDEAIASADWETIYAAAADGRLVKYNP
jgi:hypothetical protein